jgi:hypothetical protein
LPSSRADVVDRVEAQLGALGVEGGAWCGEGSVFAQKLAYT